MTAVMCLGVKCASVLQLWSGLSGAMRVLFHRWDRILGSWHNSDGYTAPARHPKTRSAQLCTDGHGRSMYRVYRNFWDSGAFSQFQLSRGVCLLMAFQSGVCAWPLTKIESITFCTSLTYVVRYCVVNQGCESAAPSSVDGVL
jgi:hypothetical protein